jgi:hypothetical protein
VDYPDERAFGVPEAGRQLAHRDDADEAARMTPARRFRTHTEL